MHRLADKIILLLLLCGSVSATTLSQFRFNVRDVMEDSATRHHSNATVDSAVNRAIVYVTNACSCLVQKDSVTTSAGTKEYSLNVKFSSIKAVYNSTKKQALYQIAVEGLGKIPSGLSTTSPNITQFYIYGLDPTDTLYHIGFEATPTDENIMWYWFYPQAKKLAGADTAGATNLPDEFHTSVIYSTIKELYLREHEFGKAKEWELQAEKEILRAKLSKAVPVDKIVEIPKVFKQ